MGTRGMMAFTHGGEVKAMYNHWDSYPDGLGKDIGKWIRNADINDAIVKFRALVKVDEDVPPTSEQKEKLLQYADLRVSGGSLDDWYVILRNTQGDPQTTLDAGFYVDGFGTGGQEYGYVIDLDKQELEVSAAGWWYDEPEPEQTSEALGGDDAGYFVIGRFSFDDIRAGKVDWDNLLPDE